MALDLDPSHLPTLAALRQIAIDAADYDKAARYLDQEQSYTTAPRQRARLLVELGKLRDEMLGDHASAVLAWEAAYEADPENEDAALPLVDEYIDDSRSGRSAEPLLDLLVRKSGKRERGEQHALQNKLGQVCAALGKDEKALKAYTAAHQLDLTDQVTIRGLAEVCFRLKDWGAALTNFQKVLTALGEDETEARADVYYKLGCIKREQGQAKQAINNFEKALARRRRRTGRRSRRSSRSTRSSRTGSRSSRTSGRSSTTSSTATSASGCSTRSPTSGTTRTRTRSKAIEALEEARELQPHEPGAAPQAHRALPGDRELVEDDRHAPGHRRQREGPGPQEQVPLHDGAALSRQGGRPGSRGRALQRGARSQPARTSRRSSASTRSSPRKKDWKALERAFRKMLRRMSTANVSNPDLEFNLWHNLGLIYRDRLKDMASAIEAFKMATRFKPDEAVERQILAELYEATDQIEAADRRARARAPEGPAARRPVPQPLQALPADARVRPRVVHVRRARVPAQGRRGGAALLRGLPAARA